VKIPLNGKDFKTTFNSKMVQFNEWKRYEVCWKHVNFLEKIHNIKDMNIFIVSEFVQDLYDGKTIVVRDWNGAKRVETI